MDRLGERSTYTTINKPNICAHGTKVTPIIPHESHETTQEMTFIQDIKKHIQTGKCQYLQGLHY